MSTPEFRSFPKIPRLVNDRMTITEKIDGTNAQVFVSEDGEVTAGSRNRWITPDADNYGFAGWVRDHKAELLTLGVGRHFGEWWGLGIQRGYGLTDKRFSLFNTFRHRELLPACVSVVPVLYEGALDNVEIAKQLALVVMNGSRAVPGWTKPEGIVVFSHMTKTCWKRLCENEYLHKSELVGASAG